MRVGVPTEIKPDEYRVAITPAGVRELSTRGHEVLIQSGAGEGSAMSDEQFAAQGAEIVADAQTVFDRAELVLKVKEPQPAEVELLREGQTLFTYLHLAAEPELAHGLTNMPGAVPITSTYALTNATLPYVLALAEYGVQAAMDRDPGLRLGCNVRGGEIVHPAVIEALAGLELERI
jgi:alanine dehydrogenase